MGRILGLSKKATQAKRVEFVRAGSVDLGDSAALQCCGRFRISARKQPPVSPANLEQYLHEHIPLSKAMGVSVVAISDDAVTLRAPLAPNINHRETVFGGSASAVSILAAWSLLHTRLQRDGIANRLVIQRSTMEFERPIWGDFTVRSSLAQPGEWQRFTRLLARKGKARMAVTAILQHASQEVGRFHGEFVALRP
jgi:thioesterase domain-containing protein